jgi:hypothetical protein
LGLQFAHPSRLYRGGPAPVHTSGLSSRNALKLALATQIGFELGKHAKHIEKALAGGGARIDRPLCGLERCTARLNDPHDVLQVADARRFMRVTMSTSPLRRKSSTVRNSSRPAVVVPLRSISELPIESSLPASGTRDSAVSYSGAVHPSVVVC